VDKWDDGSSYELYVGRWSRKVAGEFVQWLALPPAAAWLDFGCGTGALTEAILVEAAPTLVVGCDQSAGYVDYAREHITDPRVEFIVAGVADPPAIEGGFDVCVSALVLNFLPSPNDAIARFASRVRSSGAVAAYVWDYGEGMRLMRLFWDAAVALDPAAKLLDEGERFPLCRPEPLRHAFEHAGLRSVDVRAIDVPTVFQNFDDYWRPFLGGQGPAPSYLASLPLEHQARLRDVVQERLHTDASGRIALMARAWAVRGLVG
jgi:SAM-dependent methyltransferase